MIYVLFLIYIYIRNPLKILTKGSPKKVKRCADADAGSKAWNIRRNCYEVISMKFDSSEEGKGIVTIQIDIEVIFI